MPSQSVLTTIVNCLSGTVELRNNLGRTFGVDLPSTLAFDFPIAAAIAELIYKLCGAARTVVTTKIKNDVALLTPGSTVHTMVCI